MHSFPADGLGQELGMAGNGSGNGSVMAGGRKAIEGKARAFCLSPDGRLV